MKQFLKDKRGSSLVLVLTTMTFLILLAGTIITMTVTNIRLKITQKHSQENFYQTDSILDNITAGIQNASSKASADAYALALSEYNAALTSATDTLDVRYSTSYLEEMIQVLTGDDKAKYAVDGIYNYKDDVLLSYINAEEKSKYKLHGSFTDSNGNIFTGDKLLVDGYSLIIKDVSVVKEENTYETTLTTDIRIDVPSVDTESHSEYLSYAILADDQIRSDAGTTIVGVDGNIYSGTVNRNASDKKSQQGIVLTGGGQVNVNAQYIISRGDISVGNGSALSIQGGTVGDAEVWVENIMTESESSNNHITINGICNVADDLELNGQDDVVSLTGRYYGYNYNDDYSDADKLATKASHSSAISLNGKNGTLNLNGLEQLILSGRTFISKNPNTGEILTDESGNNINPDIELGESLTVKSSQLAYYVPAEFVVRAATLGVTDYDSIDDFAGDYQTVTDADGVTKDWYFFRINDATENEIYAFDYAGYTEYLDIEDTQYQNVMKDNGHKLFTDENSVEKTSFDIMDYVATQAVQIYHRRDSQVQVVDYFYLKFKDTKLASIFYQIFHQCSPQQTIYSEVDKAYLSAAGVTLNNGAEILLTSGNILYGNANDTSLSVKIQNTSAKADSPLAEYAKNKSKEYMSRQMALIRDYSDALSSSKWRLSDNNNDNLSKCGKKDTTNLFDKLVDRDALSELSGEMTVTSGIGKYIISKNDVAWNNVGGTGVESGIIITEGDVEIHTNFNGLIIAGGDVKFIGNNITVSSNAKLVEEMFEYDKSNGQMFYNLLSKYFRKSVDATIGDTSAATANNVNYENWTRN